MLKLLSISFSFFSFFKNESLDFRMRNSPKSTTTLIHNKLNANRQSFSHQIHNLTRNLRWDTNSKKDTITVKGSSFSFFFGFEFAKMLSLSCPFLIMVVGMVVVVSPCPLTLPSGKKIEVPSSGTLTALGQVCCLTNLFLLLLFPLPHTLLKKK